MIVVDADSIPFIIEYRANKHHYDAATMFFAIDNYVYDIVRDDPYVLAFSDNSSFRNDIYDQYKANREKLTRTDEFYTCREHLMTNFNSISSANYEADDILYTCAVDNPGVIMASLDKDLLQVKGYHYNYSTRQKIYVGDEGKLVMNGRKLFSSGDYLVATLLLSGDKADNIPGVRGMGPVKTFNALKDIPSSLAVEHASTYYSNIDDFNTYLSIIKLSYINDLNVDYARM